MEFGVATYCIPATTRLSNRTALTTPEQAPGEVSAVMCAVQTRLQRIGADTRTTGHGIESDLVNRGGSPTAPRRGRPSDIKHTLPRLALTTASCNAVEIAAKVSGLVCTPDNQQNDHIRIKRKNRTDITTTARHRRQYANRVPAPSRQSVQPLCTADTPKLPTTPVRASNLGLQQPCLRVTPYGTHTNKQRPT